MKIRVVGIDLGKNVFHLAAMDEDGRVVARKRLSRSQLLTFMANLSPCLVGMEACCSSHWLGRKLREQGHEIGLIPAQFVRPFVKSNKNDTADAEAIAEAVQRPTMRFVPIKTEDPLDLQALHRVRERLVARRTAVINQVRSLLLERGMTFRQGRACLRKQIPMILEDAEAQLSPKTRRLLHLLSDEWARPGTANRKTQPRGERRCCR
jgi:transposase